MSRDWLHIDRDGTALAGYEFSRGRVPALCPVVLVHGLAGYAGEWRQTAAAIGSGRRVFAPDQRGHGRSERRPGDVSPQAFTADLGAWFSALGLEPAVVVGQSMGGLTALLFAAAHPESVRGLVLVEATPDGDPEGAAEAAHKIGGWLRSWPVPFPTRTAAVEFFGCRPNWAEAWADGLEHRSDGLWPAFDPGVLTHVLEVSGQDSWAQWRAIGCRTLVVRGAGGENRDAYVRMVAENPHAELIEIEDAGHDVHLDEPDRWASALTRFLDTIDPGRTSA